MTAPALGPGLAPAVPLGVPPAGALAWPGAQGGSLPGLTSALDAVRGYGAAAVEAAGVLVAVQASEEPAGFRDFVAARWRPLLRVAWALTGDWALAEDLLQTSLAKVWPRWGSIRRTDDPDVYVRRVLVTTYATWWRRKWRGEVPTEELPEPGGRYSGGVDPGDEVVLAETLRVALATLPRRQRAVVVLRYVEDLSEADTAHVLGCSVGTVKSQASKALAKLRISPMLAGLGTADDGEVAL